MKINKKLLPLILVVLFVASVFYRVNSISEGVDQYQSYIEQGDDFAEKGVVAAAAEAYEAAQETKPSIEVTLKIGRLYQSEMGDYEMKHWYERELLRVYPNDVRTYEFAIETFLAKENYDYVFEAYEAYEESQLHSDAIDSMMEECLYLFTLNGRYDEVSPFSNATGTAAVMMDGSWDYISAGGDYVTRQDYQSAGVFGDYAAVVTEDGEPCYIDTEGEKRITGEFILENDPEFGEVKQFKDIDSGLILAGNGKIWNYYDAENYSKVFGGYADAEPVSSGIGAVCSKQGKWALVDANGKEITGFDFDGVVTDEKDVLCRTNAIVVEKNGNYSLIGIDGTPVSDKTYDMAYGFAGASYIAAYRNNRWYFVSDTGEELDLGSYEDARSFSCGLAAVKKNGKWGYIDESGKMVIPPQFYEAGCFYKEGKAFVKDDKNDWTLLTLRRGKIG